MKVFHRLRFLFICVCFFLAGLYSTKIDLQTKVAHAIQGTLNFGVTSGTTIQYFKNTAVYQSDLSFGNGAGGTSGILKSDGNVGIGTAIPGTNRLQIVGGPTSLGGATTITTGGLNMSTTGITNTGAISGATSITLNGAISGGTTGAFSSTVTAPTFSGALSGNATTATTATNQSGGSVNATTGAFSGNVTFPGSGIWNTSGNVGIGTTIPAQKLSVAGLVESTSGGFKFPDGTTMTTMATNYWTVNGTSLSYATGNVGIGTTLPATKFEVGGTASTITGTVGNLSIVPAANLLITQGKVGIGTAGPLAQLSIGAAGRSGFALVVNGRIDTPNLTANTGSPNYVCRFADANGELMYGSSCAASSRRYKDNIEPLNYGLNEIMRLQPVSYVYKKEYRHEDMTERGIGFIAEDMREIIPEVVTFDKQGLAQGISYENLVSLAIKGIQALDKKITTQDSKIGTIDATTKLVKDQQYQINQLKADNDELKARLSKVEMMVNAGSSR